MTGKQIATKKTGHKLRPYWQEVFTIAQFQIRGLITSVRTHVRNKFQSSRDIKKELRTRKVKVHKTADPLHSTTGLYNNSYTMLQSYLISLRRCINELFYIIR